MGNGLWRYIIFPLGQYEAMGWVLKQIDRK